MMKEVMAGTGSACDRCDGRHQGMLDKSPDNLRSEGRSVKTTGGARAHRGVLVSGRWICPTPNDADDHWWCRVITSDGHAHRAQCGLAQRAYLNAPLNALWHRSRLDVFCGSKQVLAKAFSASLLHRAGLGQPLRAQGMVSFLEPPVPPSVGG